MLDWLKNRFKGEKSYETNEEWIEGLSDPVNEQAVEQLRAKLIRGLKPALHKYVDYELDQFVEDTAQDALIKILDNIGSFRGESKLITWAMKIAVREGLTELRLKRYDDAHIEEFKYPNEDGRNELNSTTFATNSLNPEERAQEKMVLEKVLDVIQHDLTNKQQKAIETLMLQELPISVVAEKMDTNRNALYKLVHDARIKLKTKLKNDGIDPEEIFNQM